LFNINTPNTTSTEAKGKVLDNRKYPEELSLLILTAISPVHTKNDNYKDDDKDIKIILNI